MRFFGANTVTYRQACIDNVLSNTANYLSILTVKMANNQITDWHKTNISTKEMIQYNRFFVLQIHFIVIIIETSSCLYNSILLLLPFHHSEEYWYYLLNPPCIASHKHTTSREKKIKYVHKCEEGEW